MQGRPSLPTAVLGGGGWAMSFGAQRPSAIKRVYATKVWCALTSMGVAYLLVLLLQATSKRLSPSCHYIQDLLYPSGATCAVNLE